MPAYLFVILCILLLGAPRLTDRLGAVGLLSGLEIYVLFIDEGLGSGFLTTGTLRLILFYVVIFDPCIV